MHTSRQGPLVRPLLRTVRGPCLKFNHQGCRAGLFSPVAVAHGSGELQLALSLPTRRQKHTLPVHSLGKTQRPWSQVPVFKACVCKIEAKASGVNTAHFCISSLVWPPQLIPQQQGSDLRPGHSPRIPAVAAEGSERQGAPWPSNLVYHEPSPQEVSQRLSTTKQVK